MKENAIRKSVSCEISTLTLQNAGIVQPLISNARLEILKVGKDRLDVDDGRAVDGFDRADAQAILDDLADGDAMKADGIWTVGRARGEYAGERTARDRSVDAP